MSKSMFASAFSPHWSPLTRLSVLSSRRQSSVLFVGIFFGARHGEKMGLWTLLEGLLLLANAFAVLNEDRFLSKRGWNMQEFPGGRAKSLKGQVIGLIYATQYLRVPLIILNTICIIVKFVSG